MNSRPAVRRPEVHHGAPRVCSAGLEFVKHRRVAMDDLSVTDILMSGLRIFNIFASLVGILVGVDLIFGGRMISLVNKTLSKTFELDKAVTKAFNSLKGQLDKEISLEKALFQTKIRIVVGVLIILTAGILFNLTR